MKVTGFSFVRNAVKYGYPIVESVQSILPLCDRFVLSVGNSEDGTLELVQSIDSDKLHIIESVWDDSLREGGRVLAVETDKAYAAIDTDSDWCFYIQADEVVHEQYLPAIQAAMEQWKDHPEVEGLLLKYLHFYGTYNYVGDSRQWYRKEIRVVRHHPDIQSYKDAQGFRKVDRKLQVKPVEAWMYHYGWVKPPAQMLSKVKNFHRYWHSDQWIAEQVAEAEQFDYSQIDSLKRFTGTHPEVMQSRIQQLDWNTELDTSQKRLKLKDRILLSWEKLTGHRPFEYQNYKVI